MNISIITVIITIITTTTSTTISAELNLAGTEFIDEFLISANMTLFVHVYVVLAG